EAVVAVLCDEAVVAAVLDLAHAAERVVLVLVVLAVVRQVADGVVGERELDTAGAIGVAGVQFVDRVVRTRVVVLVGVGPAPVTVEVVLGAVPVARVGEGPFLVARLARDRA